MARIRIVDEWIRSPIAMPTRSRAIMVVAEKWAEQRVLMRAYAESRDQTRPTIMLHGTELPIGPASSDAQGSWGIHVPRPSSGGSTDDGTAQSLCAQLELAAKRLSGSRGNPPRLLDEESDFERNPTNNWAPMERAGTPNVRAVRPQAATLIPQTVGAEIVNASPVPIGPAIVAAIPAGGSLRRTPVPRPSTNRSKHTPAGNSGTSLGFQSGAGAQSALVRLGLSPVVSQRLSRLTSRTVSTDFQITRTERFILNTLGEKTMSFESISARELSILLGVADAVGWMEALISKLEGYGLDLIVPGDARGGDPTYLLRL